MDALVDLPFALPTAVAGITLAALYSQNGWIGRWLAPFGIKISYTWLGIFVALTFIGLPFIVRTVQPVLEDLDLGSRGGRGQPWREPVQDLFPRHSADVFSGAADRFRAGVRPRAGRIRLGRLHFQQHSDENANRAGAHHEQAGRISTTPARRRWRSSCSSFPFCCCWPSICCNGGANVTANASDHGTRLRIQAIRRPGACIDGRAAFGALAADRRRAGVSRAVSGRAARGGVRGGVRQGRRLLFSYACATR